MFNRRKKPKKEKGTWGWLNDDRIVIFGWTIPLILAFAVNHLSLRDFLLHSSKVEMNKWIEDLNMAIDMSKKCQEKSDLLLDPSLCDRSNSKYLKPAYNLFIRCAGSDVFLFLSLLITDPEVDVNPTPSNCSSLSLPSPPFFLSLHTIYKDHQMKCLWSRSQRMTWTLPAALWTSRATTGPTPPCMCAGTATPASLCLTTA